MWVVLVFFVAFLLVVVCLSALAAFLPVLWLVAFVLVGVFFRPSVAFVLPVFLVARLFLLVLPLIVAFVGVRRPAAAAVRTGMRWKV